MSFRSYISEDSVISINHNTSKSAFRVSINLHRFFKDFRARCYIHVKRNCRVRWLEKRLKKIFLIPGSFCLCSNGHYLPPGEPLDLLRPDDSVEVIPVIEACMNFSQNKSPQPLSTYNHRNKDREEDVSNEAHSRSSTNNFLPSQNHNQIILNETETHKVSNMSEDDSDKSLPINKDNVDGQIATTTNNTQHSEDFDSLLDNNITKSNSIQGDKETNEQSYNLEEVKLRALALLDSQCSAQGGSEAEIEEPPLKRTRRRVRRRSRRTRQLGPASVQEMAGSEVPCATESFNGTLECLSISCPDPEAAVSLQTEEPKALSLLPEVVRNETAYPRKPRFVRPLGIEN